jgi:hypothetical protein
MEVIDEAHKDLSKQNLGCTLFRTTTRRDHVTQVFLGEALSCGCSFVRRVIVRNGEVFHFISGPLYLINHMILLFHLSTPQQQYVPG